MKLIIHIAVGIVSFVMAGCSTMPDAVDQGSVVKTTVKTDGSKDIIENLSDYAIYAKHAGEKQPLFEMTCPANGCVLASLKVNSPDSGSKLAGPPKSTSAIMAEGFMGMFNNLVDKATSVVPWYFGASVLKKGFDAASGKSVTTNTTTSTDDHSNRSVDSSNRSVTTTTTTDNSNRSVTTDNSNRSTTTPVP
jgi:hypothetical protein